MATVGYVKWRKEQMVIKKFLNFIVISWTFLGSWQVKERARRCDRGRERDWVTGGGFNDCRGGMWWRCTWRFLPWYTLCDRGSCEGIEWRRRIRSSFRPVDALLYRCHIGERVEGITFFDHLLADEDGYTSSLRTRSGRRTALELVKTGRVL